MGAIEGMAGELMDSRTSVSVVILAAQRGAA